MLHLVPSLLVITIPPPGDAYAFILDCMVYPAQWTSIAVAIGLLVLRKREPYINRPFRAWTIAPYIQILAALGLLASPFVYKKESRGDVSFW